MGSPTQGARFVLVVTAALLLVSTLSFADSQVRMVRLSDVEGAVQIDRNTGLGFEKAAVNLPITEGVSLRTGHDGFASVEFEDGTTLRMTPGTLATFSELRRRDSGASISTTQVQKGMAYVNFLASKNDEFSITFGAQTVKLDRPAHLRLDVGATEGSLAVLKGDLQVQSPSGVVAVGKKQTATFYLNNQAPYSLAKNVQENPYDDWDKQQDDYDQHYAKGTTYNGSPYQYGASDLNYYGNFFNVAGYGMMWQPYFAGAGWDPFMDGVWAFYPGMGYGWASAYPWGWLPYHSGSWMFLPSYGWMWQPGGAWMGLNNMPHPVSAPSGYKAPVAPTTPSRSLIAVSHTPAVAPGASASQNLIVRNNSAGLGIPRGSVQNLSHMSQQANQHGFVAARIQPQMANPLIYRSMGNGSARAAESASGAPRYSAPAPAMAPMAAPTAGAHSGGAHK